MSIKPPWVMEEPPNTSLGFIPAWQQRNTSPNRTSLNH
jgi:hypothetical protein